MTSLQGNFLLTALLKGRCAAADAEYGGVGESPFNLVSGAVHYGMFYKGMSIQGVGERIISNVSHNSCFFFLCRDFISWFLQPCREAAKLIWRLIG